MKRRLDDMNDGDLCRARRKIRIRKKRREEEEGNGRGRGFKKIKKKEWIVC